MEKRKLPLTPSDRPLNSTRFPFKDPDGYARCVVDCLTPLILGAPMTMHKGSCHCGGITFEVEAVIDYALSCNCSICSRKGSLLWFAPRNQLRLLTPEQDISTYVFNRHVIKHCFCSTCGIHPFGEGVDPSGQNMVAVNLRCLEDFDLASVPVQTYDGRAL